MVRRRIGFGGDEFVGWERETMILRVVWVGGPDASQCGDDVVLAF